MFSFKKINIMEGKKFQKQFSKIFQNKRHIHRLKRFTMSQEKIIRTINTGIYPNQVIRLQG